MANQFCSYSMCTRCIERSHWCSERESLGLSFSSSPLAGHRDSSPWIGECLESLSRGPDTLLKRSHGKQVNGDCRLNKPLRPLCRHWGQSLRTAPDKPGNLSKQPVLPSDKYIIDFGPSLRINTLSNNFTNSDQSHQMSYSERVIVSGGALGAFIPKRDGIIVIS
jgi:hypothetical protein